MEHAHTPKRDVMGVVLILVGVLLLMRNLGAGFGLVEIWPWFIMLFGVALLAMFISDRAQYVLLMPAAILVLGGVVFELCVLFGWSLMGALWPILVIAPGMGFMAMYLLGPGGSTFLLPGAGLTFLGIVMLLRQTGIWKYWPIALISAGFALVIKSLRRRH